MLEQSKQLVPQTKVVPAEQLDQERLLELRTTLEQRARPLHRQRMVRHRLTMAETLVETKPEPA